MVAPPSSWSTLLLLAACTVAGCASGPQLPRALEVAEGELTTVRLLQIEGKLQLSLQNESAGHADQVYAALSPDPSRKVVSDADLQALLDVFAGQGMFAQSLAQVPPDARDVLTVQAGDRTWTWVRRQRGVQQGEAAFHEARAYFLALYNSSVAYHGTGEDRPDFGTESRRAKVDAATATSRLRALRRGQ
jgi:hypothetical protein